MKILQLLSSKERGALIQSRYDAEARILGEKARAMRRSRRAAQGKGAIGVALSSVKVAHLQG